MSRRFAVLLSLLAALIPLGWLVAGASATDTKPCGAASTRNAGGTITTQNCPVFVPASPGYIPVTAFKPAATTVGKLLKGGDVNWFLCQQQGPSTTSGGFTNDWWALTLSDDNHRGWVSEVYFSGGSNNEADGALRACTASDINWGNVDGAGTPPVAAPAPTPTPGPTSTPGPAPTATPVATPPPSAPPARLDADLKSRWALTKGGKTRFTTLTVSNIPNGAAVELRCKGSGCPTKKASAKVSSKGTANVAALLKHRFFKKGVVIEVRITAPGTIGKVVQYTTRDRRRDPSSKKLCLMPGEANASTCPSV